MARSGLGMRICSGVSAVRKSRPASSSRTRIAGSSLSRAASTAPAEPPPTMTKSYSSCIRFTSIRHDGHGLDLDLGAILYQCRDLHHGHRRKVPPHDLAIDLSD